jgi:hypothetical protein
MTKKPRFSVFVLLVICLTSEPVSANGQQTAAAGPSLEETLLFLTNAVANEGTCDVHFGDMVCMRSVLERNGSILTLTSGLIPRGGRPPKESYELVFSKDIETFDLKALDPSAVTLVSQALCVHMVSTNGVKAVSESFPNSDNPGDRKGGQNTKVDVCFTTKETAQRAAKAFQHAIELSGGKASAF